MKKSLIIALAAVAVLFSGCKDMLEEEVYGQPTAEELLANEENVAKVVGQAYSEVKWLHDHWGYWGINTISSDECVNPVRNPGSDWNDDGYWKGFNDHSWTANDMSFEFVWQYSNAGAVLCNKILSQLKGIENSMDSAVYKRFTAELKVLRCYYYYTLFDAFGRIPYQEDYSADRVPQSETWEVWNKLVTTLEAEAPNLPVITDDNRAENYGRCSQGMAYTLLARLYLNALSFGVTPTNCGIAGITSDNDFYQKALTACKKVIDSHSYIIEDDFFTNFKINNENSRENIFVIVEDGNASFDYRDVAGKLSNKLRITMLTLNYTHQQCWGLKEKPWNGFCAPEDFLDKYAYGVDHRGPCDSTLGTHGCDGWGWFLGPVYKDEMSMDTLVMTDKGNLKAVMRKHVASLDNATHNDGARLLKYEVAKNGVNKYCDNDFVLFRYADVLYMAYEAAYRLGDGYAATLLADPDFQLIRTRAGVPAYSSLDLDELLDERGREFAWEMVRRRDLIRFNKYSKGSWNFKPAAADNHCDWFPIPRKMIETSGGMWTQNPGYETDM
ncbi:MAG: RagB/SusD family nutrient uptake outer membrane protein [Paludibacteraceae bacterium]|nr:RagB/SusD family nutrient uptake outer membrane protein [Paludibacteraceae bacterium]